MGRSRKLSRKGAKRRTQGRERRSTGTRASTPVTFRESRAEMAQQIEACRRELAEAREQQTVTSEVLQVISSSLGEPEPVFQAMLENAVRLCGAKFGILYSYDGAAFHAISLMVARLATKPRSTGSLTPVNTIGTVLVASCVAVSAGPPFAKITFGVRRMICPTAKRAFPRSLTPHR